MDKTIKTAVLTVTTQVDLSMARRQEQADLATLAAWHTEKDRLVAAVEGAKAYLVAFTLKHGKKVPAELEEGWWTQADLKVGVPSIWVRSDSQHYAELLPFSVRDVGKYAEAEERIRQLVDTNRMALGTWKFTPKKLAQAGTLKSVILRLEAALEAHRQQFPVVQYCYQPPQQPLWRHVETSGSKLVPDTAPADVRLAVAAAKVRHAEEKSPASLRALNAALAKAAQGAPLDAVIAPAKPVGRALVDSTRIEPVYEALRRNIHSLDSRLGRMLCAFALRGDDKKVVSRVTKAVTLLFGSLPSEVRDATYWGIQKAAAKQAFIALKSGALDATKRGWTERALVENARLFAAVCAARLDGESFAPAQANGLDPLDAIQEYQELATDLEGQFEFEGEEEVELEELDFGEGVCMDAAAEDEDEGVDEDESLDQVVELLAAEGDRQIDSLLGYSAHWDELPEMFAKVKVASTEEAMKKAVSVATEAFESELLRDFL